MSYQQWVGGEATGSVEDDAVGDVGEGERAEALRSESPCRQQPQGEVPEAGDSLVDHAPPESAHDAERC